jgi:hypothetical protein
MELEKDDVIEWHTVITYWGWWTVVRWYPSLALISYVSRASGRL